MGVKAVHSDGSTYLEHDVFTSIPLSSRYGFLSFWYKIGNNNGYVLNTFAPSFAGARSVTVYLNAASGLLDVQLLGDPTIFGAGDNQLHKIGSANAPFDELWHHYLMTWDTQANSLICYLDNVSYAMVDSPFLPNTAVPFDVDYSAVDYVWTVGRIPNVSSVPASVVDLAELFFLAGTPVDITDPDVRAKFIDPDTLLPVAIDAGGLWPFFDSLQVIPQIWLSGNQDLFPRNYPGWSATCVSQTDSDPTSQFAVVAGNLTTADSDPFGQTNVSV